MEEKFEYKLPPGNGPIKKALSFKKMSPIQQKIYKRIYDPVNGILEFLNHCIYVNRNGIQQYKPFDYQKEMVFDIHNYDRSVNLLSRQNGKCCLGETNIKIRNKKTGKIETISIEELANRLKMFIDK